MTKWVVLFLMAVLLGGCGFTAETYGQDPEAQRILAEGQQAQARAGATATVIAAQSMAQATSAALELEERQQLAGLRAESSERAHRQFLETVPIMILAITPVLVLGMVIIVVWVKSHAPQPAWPQVTMQFEEYKQQQIANDAAMWRALAHMTRSLPPREQQRYIVYDEHGKRVE